MCLYNCDKNKTRTVYLQFVQTVKTQFVQIADTDILAKMLNKHLPTKKKILPINTYVTGKKNLLLWKVCHFERDIHFIVFCLTFFAVISWESILDVTWYYLLLCGVGRNLLHFF